jgi:hypothetical protein
MGSTDASTTDDIAFHRHISDFFTLFEEFDDTPEPCWSVLVPFPKVFYHGVTLDVRRIQRKHSSEGFDILGCLDAIIKSFLLRDKRWFQEDIRFDTEMLLFELLRRSLVRAESESFIDRLCS